MGEWGGAIQNRDYAITIGRCYAAPHATAAYVGGATVEAWQGDHRLQQPGAYDRIPIARRREPLPILPDATCWLVTQAERRPLFVEVDQGTRPIRSWAEKALAYHAYRGSHWLRQRYGTDGFLLLVIAPSESRITRIAETIVDTTRTPEGVLFLLRDAIHPTTIRTHWRQIAHVTWSTRHLPQGVVATPEVSLAPAALWAPADRVTAGGGSEGGST